MPTLEEANRKWERLLEKANTNLRQIPKLVADEIRKNPITPDAVGPVAGPFNEIMSEQTSFLHDPVRGQPTNILNIFRAFARPPMTPAQEDAFLAYLIRIYEKSIPVLVSAVTDQVKAERVLSKDLEMQRMLRPYLTASKEPVSVEAARAGVGSLSLEPDERGFARPRPGVDEAPARPSGMGERSNAAAVAPAYLAPPRSGSAPARPGAGPPGSAAAMGGRRRKTTRLPSRLSRRRRSTRSRRNRGGAKFL